MGLVLATLAGPIFFTLVQTGIERGVVAGFAVGLGEWSSDLLYIAAAYFGLVWLNKQSRAVHNGAGRYIFTGVNCGLVPSTLGENCAGF